MFLGAASPSTEESDRVAYSSIRVKRLMQTVAWRGMMDRLGNGLNKVAERRIPVLTGIGCASAGLVAGGLLAGNLTASLLFAGLGAGLTCALLARPVHRPAEESFEDEVVHDYAQDFEQVIAAAGCACLTWKLDSPTLALSPALASIIGLSPRRTLLTPEKFRLLQHPADPDLLNTFKIKAPRAGGPIAIDTRLRHADGRWIPVRISGGMRIGLAEAGTIEVIVTDRSEAEYLERRAALFEKRMHELAEGLPHAVSLWDSSHRLIYWNKAFPRLHLLDEDQLEPGLAHDDIFDRPMTLPGDLQAGRLEVLRAEGGRWLVEFDSTSTHGRAVLEGDTIAKIQKLRFDLMKANDRIADQQSQLDTLAKRTVHDAARVEAANRSIAEFLANTSHELRTPLNAILGFSEMMEQQIFGPLGSDKYIEYISDIRASGQNLLALINDILDMSKIESGQFDMTPDPMDVKSAVTEAMRLAGPLAKEKSITLSQDESTSRIPRAFADAQAIKRVLLHLFRNAIKFTPENGKVTVEAEADLHRVRIIVSDTGIGIHPDDLGQVGTPFFRGRLSEEKGLSGMGLGLALCRSILQLNSGSIVLESDPGEGTRVILTLPRRAPKEAREPGAEPIRRRMDGPIIEELSAGIVG